MKHFKRFIYKMLAEHYGNCVASYVDSFELASLCDDHRGMEYCDKIIAKYLTKQDKYMKKLNEL